jgi:heme exporter protein B
MAATGARGPRPETSADTPPAGADRAGPTVVSAVAALVRKDVRLELRTRESVPAMFLFSLSTFVLFRFGLDRETLEGDLASGVLWVTLLFAAMLGISRLFVADHEEGGLDGFLLAPTDRTALLVAKAVSLFAFLAALEVIAVPAFALLLLGPAPGPGTYGQLALLLALADAGIALVGTLVGAIAVQSRARDLLVPLIALPLLIPVVIAAARGTTPLVLEAGARGVEVRWVLVLGLYDLIFGLLAYALFDYLIEA